MIDYADRAINLNNLGMNSSHQGNLDKALKYFEEALSEMKRASGDKENSHHYLNYLRIKDNLGDTYLQLGRFNEALEYFESATKAAEKRYGSIHPEMGTFYSNLGRGYFQKNELVLAETYFKKALDVNRLHLPHEHEYIARDLANVASVLDKCGQHSSARKLLEEALSIEEKTLGANHHDLIATHESLGLALMGELNLSAAKKHYERAHELAQRALGKSHPKTTELRQFLAQFDASPSAPATTSNKLPVIFSDSVYVKGTGKVLLGTNTALALLQLIKAHDFDEAKQIIKQHSELLKPIIDTKMQQLAQEQVDPLARMRIEALRTLLTRARADETSQTPIESGVQASQDEPISPATIELLQIFKNTVLRGNNPHATSMFMKTHPEVNHILMLMSKSPHSWKAALDAIDPELAEFMEMMVAVFTQGYRDNTQAKRRMPWIRGIAGFGGLTWIVLVVLQFLRGNEIHLDDYYFIPWLAFSLSWGWIYWLIRKPLGVLSKLAFIVTSIALLGIGFVPFIANISGLTSESVLHAYLYVIAIGFVISSVAIRPFARSPNRISNVLIIMALTRIPFIAAFYTGHPVLNFVSDMLFGLGWILIAWMF